MNKILKKNIVIFFLIIGFGSMVQTLPNDWLASLASLESLTSGLSSSLLDDVTLYQAEAAKVDALSVLINANKALRQSTFSCIKSKFDTLKNDLNGCQSSELAATIAQGIIDVDALILELNALKTSTDNDITSLSKEKSCLQTQYDLIDGSLRSDLGIYESEASALLTSLNSFKIKFDNAIAERQSLSSKISTLLSDLDTESKLDLADIALLNTAICQSADPAALESSYTSPSIPNPVGLTSGSVDLTNLVCTDYIYTVTDGSCIVDQPV
ncbi:MAG: hypothetical protein NTZ68_04055 [Candidatus Dependentiae bacterium]|nr:hypothetical protein [Candidatus Dependentiae bacterium]